MLILNRKLDDSLLIEIEGQDKPIEIKVTDIGGGQVRLGIAAPKNCKIWRKELYQTVLSNRQAAEYSPNAALIRSSLRQQLAEKKDGAE